MNLALVGINHRTAPVEVRERMNIVEDRLPAAVHELISREGIEEGLILSTCNRVEIITRASDQADPGPILMDFLSAFHHCDLAPYEKHFYWHRQHEVIRHLFRVASSLDSMILGEPQVLGQIKSAAATAASAGALRGPLSEIVRQALAVAKRVRRETAIGATAVSVSYAAVELSRKIFGSLEGKTIFVIGAGKMSELAAKHLLRSGASAIFVSNRTFGRAEELAQAFHGTAIRFEELFDHIHKADIVICSTAAPHYVIDQAHAERWLEARKNRPMFFVDIAVPRNVEPSINQLSNAFVYDIDDLGQVVEANRKQREREAAYAEEIINQEVQRTLRRLAAHDLAPTIVALEDRLNHIREGEMDRLRGKLAGLTPEQREAVEMLTRSIQNKILHGPITELKDGAGQPGHGTLVHLVRKIFGIAE